MKYLAIRSLALALIAASAATASAQSLADVARREEERRKAMGTSGKVYTNDHLRSGPSSVVGSPAPDQTAPTTGAGAPATGAAPAADAPADAGKAAGQVPPGTKALSPEETWRKRVADERAAVSRSQVLADALQSRINALTTDFENRSDPAQRNVIFADRQKALAELDRVKKEIDQHQKAITVIQEEARRAGVPAGWTR